MALVKKKKKSKKNSVVSLSAHLVITLLFTTTIFCVQASNLFDNERQSFGYPEDIPKPITGQTSMILKFCKHIIRLSRDGQ